jgi:uncharacterized protein involved in exopolysaccharide biosynthesis
MTSRELETSHLERASEPRTRAGAPIDAQRVVRALYRSRYAILSAILVGGVLGAVAGPSLFPPSYNSSVTIRFDGLPAMPGLAPPTYGSVNAYADGLYAEPVLMEVRRQLGDQVPASLEGIRSLIVMTADPQSGAIRAEVSAATPEGARKFGEVLGRAFTEYQTEQLRARLDEAHRRLDDQLSLARLAHRRARASWDAFRKEHEIESLETEHGRLAAAAQLRAEAIMAGNEALALEDRVKTLKRAIERVPKLAVSQHQETSPEATRLAEAEAELALKESRLTLAHPEVEALRRQVQMLRVRHHNGQPQTVTTQIYGPNAERSTMALTLAEAESALAAARGRAAGLSHHADAAEEKVAAFGAVEGEALVLLSNLQVQRELEQRLEGERARVAAAILQPESGFSIVKPAHLPQTAVANKMGLVATLLIPILVLFATLVFVLGREVEGLRVRTPAELAYWAGAPVIGATTWPNEPGCLDELIEGLDDFVPTARGEFLVVGASAWDAALSETIAARLGADFVDDTDGERVKDERGREELALRDRSAIEKRSPSVIRATPWGGETRGPSLRRAARLADRVLVVVSSGALSATEITGLKRRIGREEGVAFVMVNVPRYYQNGPDRVGPVADFWALG